MMEAQEAMANRGGRPRASGHLERAVRLGQGRPSPHSILLTLQAEPGYQGTSPS